MQYTTLGRTGLVVSRLAFGAMTFGTGQLVPGVTNSIDQTEADKMVGRVLEAGINLFDTADAYTSGQSEIILGKALGKRRQEVAIATSCRFSQRRCPHRYRSFLPPHHRLSRGKSEATGN